MKTQSQIEKTNRLKKFFSETENQAALFCLFLAVAMAVPVIANFKTTFEHILLDCIFVLPFLLAAVVLFIYGNKN